MSSDFFRLMAEISASIQTLSYNTHTINTLSKKIGTIQDSDQIRTELSQLTYSTEELAKQIGEEFKTLNQLAVSLPPLEQRDRRIQSNRLCDQFMSTLSQFQKQQRELLERQKNSNFRARMNKTPGSVVGGDDEKLPPPPPPSASGRAIISNSDPDDIIETDPFVLPVKNTSTNKQMMDTFAFKGADSKKMAITQQQQLQLTTQYELALDYMALAEREQEMRRLEGGIVLANHIFRDMAQLIYEQNVTLDKVEGQIEMAAGGFVVQGNGELLEQTVRFNNKARKRRRVYCLILLIVLIIIGLSIGIYFGLKNED